MCVRCLKEGLFIPSKKKVRKVTANLPSVALEVDKEKEISNKESNLYIPNSSKELQKSHFGFKVIAAFVLISLILEVCLKKKGKGD
jgi:hypothetical protein